MEYVRKKKKELKDDKKRLETICSDKLGFDPDDKMSQLDLFKTFLHEKIFKKKSKGEIQDLGLNRIDICYKLDEMAELQKKSDELNEKIQKIEFDPYISGKNKEKELEGDDRNFYSNF